MEGGVPFAVGADGLESARAAVSAVAQHIVGSPSGFEHGLTAFEHGQTAQERSPNSMSVVCAHGL
eukprot:2717057-Rhodomonas_salina.1